MIRFKADKTKLPWEKSFILFVQSFLPSRLASYLQLKWELKSLALINIFRHSHTSVCTLVWRRTGSWGHLCGQRNIFIYWNVPSNRSLFSLSPPNSQTRNRQNDDKNLENYRFISVYLVYCVVSVSHCVCQIKSNSFSFFYLKPDLG